MRDTLKVGVVGVGYLGRFHALIYSRLAGVELVGVADVDAERAAAVAAEAGCEAFADPSALLGRVDAVSIVVPTSLHLPVARPYLEQGVHMLLEKPVAPDLDAGREIVRLAEASGATLQIGHLERFNAGIAALAGRIESPRFIEAQRMGGFTERATDVDVVSDLMIHDIDIILALVDADLADVRAVGSPVLTEHVDIANARLEFVNGTVANVVASRVSDKTTRRIRVFQPRGYLSLDFVEQTLDIATPVPQPDAARPQIHRERIQVEPVKPLDREIAAFVDCVRHHRRPLVHGAVGLQALEVALQVRERIGA
ncbi:Gfo/Idh/MocA family oxidoreductase [Thiohalocapsa marina]|uniref:Gfo/Idh/MocA family oxidoreductase n=1 Tax=Thiohalocapsa marina TaxID=424902 RepID=A0A5M8FEX5_9GAMM|nr:Gfo/Idh/MocA family oxidoreductase [Thiohalocapsa marina]KAA6183433.1 Gfo/Idh/MocA family oxidoreductase [Thiohalocapsa marina]